MVAEKEKNEAPKKKLLTAQAAYTTTSIARRRTHGTAHLVAARIPAACVYFSAFRRMRLSHTAVVSKAYKKNVS